VRDADESNIDVRSARAGHRGLASVSRCFARRLQRTVNAAKSAVHRPWRRKFLGFTCPGGRLTAGVRVCRDKPARCERVQVSDSEGLATHAGPESCVDGGNASSVRPLTALWHHVYDIDRLRRERG
jgi:hypothetical protein